MENEALQNEAEKVSAKTDGLMGHIKAEALIDNDADMIECKSGDALDDSSDESSDEDSAVEFMPNGELVRKKSRGFKQLNNCKRFWKASLMIGKGKFGILNIFQCN